jgi:hypothetical protein
MNFCSFKIKKKEKEKHENMDFLFQLFCPFYLDRYIYQKLPKKHKNPYRLKIT